MTFTFWTAPAGQEGVMVRRVQGIRVEGRLAGRRLAREAGVSLGRRVREARVRRAMSQRVLAEKVGVDRSRISQLEQGAGYRAPLDVWFSLSHVLNIPLKVEFWRDALETVADAGHLKIQELMLRLARTTGRARMFELATRPSDPALSIDVYVATTSSAYS
jgi:DNA-binding XRE family transcriptional regulator